MPKQYDREYFDRWYRRDGFGSRAHLERKVRFALGAVEYLLERPARSVLDVGCGEGAWQPVLGRLRPRASYLGIDPSPYAIDRFGSSRNLVRGGLADVEDLTTGCYDLVVCVDVVPYATDRDAEAGIEAIGRRTHGLALVELFTSMDDFEGDRREYRRRRPRTYEKWFAAAGLRRVGPNLFSPVSRLSELSYFERGG